MIVERFPPDIGGSGLRFFKIAQRLARRHRIDIFTLGTPNVPNSAESFNIYRLNADKLAILRYHGTNRVIVHSLSTFFRCLFRSYNIIDVDFWPPSSFFSAKVAKPGTRVVVSWNVVWPFSVYRSIGEISNVFAYALSKLSSYNIAVSELARNLLLEHSNLRPDKIEVIPNGIDDAFFKARVEPQWGRMVFVGRLEPQKRLDLLLEAFRIVKKRFSDIELHIVGSGPLYPQLLSASKKMNGLYLHDSIPAHRVDELISELSRSWIFVSASEFETFGLSIAESLSLGLPAVITQTPYNCAINEIAKHDCNSLIVEHNKPKAIAEALEMLYKDEKLWEKLSRNAKDSTPFYTWDEVAERVEAVYQKVAEKVA